MNPSLEAKGPLSGGGGGVRDCAVRDLRHEVFIAVKSICTRRSYDSDTVRREILKLSIADDLEILQFALGEYATLVAEDLRRKSRWKYPPPSQEDHDASDREAAAAGRRLGERMDLMNGYRLWDGTVLGDATREKLQEQDAHHTRNIIGNMHGSYIMRKLMKMRRLKGDVKVRDVTNERKLQALYEEAFAISLVAVIGEDNKADNDLRYGV